MFDKNQLPDIASAAHSDSEYALQWVGMDGIALPLLFPFEAGNTVSVNAFADAYVSLMDPGTKGIHMSRLYLLLKNQLTGAPLTLNRITDLLGNMINSQDGISDAAMLRLCFEFTLEKKALLSAEKGYQTYPVELTVQQVNGKLSTNLKLTIPYSSTCPCSAALSRQLLASRVGQQFEGATIDKAVLLDWLQSEDGSVATPHSQRSFAYISLSFAEDQLPELSSLIKKFESVIGTPVQTAVKREDEQAFAKLNAENLMFCEDAARRLKAALEAMPFVDDYWFKVEHQESLHAHNAVVVDRKCL